jgi:hypothetical protein
VPDSERLGWLLTRVSRPIFVSRQFHFLSSLFSGLFLAPENVLLNRRVKQPDGKVFAYLSG